MRRGGRYATYWDVTLGDEYSAEGSAAQADYLRQKAEELGEWIDEITSNISEMDTYSGRVYVAMQNAGMAKPRDVENLVRAINAVKALLTNSRAPSMSGLLLANTEAGKEREVTAKNRLIPAESTLFVATGGKPATTPPPTLILGVTATPFVNQPTDAEVRQWWAELSAATGGLNRLLNNEDWAAARVTRANLNRLVGLYASKADGPKPAAVSQSRWDNFVTIVAAARTALTRSEREIPNLLDLLRGRTAGGKTAPRTVVQTIAPGITPDGGTTEEPGPEADVMSESSTMLRAQTFITNHPLIVLAGLALLGAGVYLTLKEKG